MTGFNNGDLHQGDGELSGFSSARFLRESLFHSPALATTRVPSELGNTSALGGRNGMDAFLILDDGLLNRGLPHVRTRNQFLE